MTRSAARANDRIINFHSGARPDDRGRYLQEIQQWTDDRLESVHDYIQWMFPLPQPSAVNPHAPVLDGATIAEFQSRPELQQSLRSSFLRILGFYGLTMLPGAAPRIEPAPQFDRRADVWLSSGNHNHLRITRIIRSLRLLGLEPEARAFFDCLTSIYERQPAGPPSISAETFRFWRSAANDAL